VLRTSEHVAKVRMSTLEPRSLRVGDPAPGFTLPAAEREGTVSLADYRGTSAVLLAINRGLWCSFCRRYIAHLGRMRERLQRMGVETLGIVAAQPDRARLYVRHRAVAVPLALDPDLGVHRAYGLSMPPMTPELGALWARMRVRLDEAAVSPAELSDLRAVVGAEQKGAVGGSDQAVPLPDFITMTRRLHPYETTESEEQERARYNTLGTGQFLVDREGVLRWARVQSVTQLPAALSDPPSESELLAAARGLT
jgi:peroxiredoxin